jgi:TPP-dependent trihydroxycyclohexane-1,2-dione (THcHDO) dehydratase
MKVQFNLTKEEAAAFSNFMNSVNVNNLTETDFCKSAFIIGLQAMEQSIIAEVQKRMEAEAADASGVEIVEDTDETTDADSSTEE